MSLITPRRAVQAELEIESTKHVGPAPQVGTCCTIHSPFLALGQPPHSLTLLFVTLPPPHNLRYSWRQALALDLTALDACLQLLPLNEVRCASPANRKLIQALSTQCFFISGALLPFPIVVNPVPLAFLFPTQAKWLQRYREPQRGWCEGEVECRLRPGEEGFHVSPRNDVSVSYHPRKLTHPLPLQVLGIEPQYLDATGQGISLGLEASSSGDSGTTGAPQQQEMAKGSAELRPGMAYLPAPDGPTTGPTAPPEGPTPHASRAPQKGSAGGQAAPDLHAQQPRAPAEPRAAPAAPREDPDDMLDALLGSPPLPKGPLVLGQCARAETAGRRQLCWRNSSHEGATSRCAARQGTLPFLTSLVLLLACRDASVGLLCCLFRSFCWTGANVSWAPILFVLAGGGHVQPSAPPLAVSGIESDLDALLQMGSAGSSTAPKVGILHAIGRAR